jgi:hypothetical protein
MANGALYSRHGEPVVQTWRSPVRPPGPNQARAIMGRRLSAQAVLGFPMNGELPHSIDVLASGKESFAVSPRARVTRNGGSDTTPVRNPPTGLEEFRDR